MADLERSIDELGETALRIKAERDEMLAALRSAYSILCAGNPPHSARESNARRVIRTAIEKAGSS